jgi:hydroxypyruvate isomerase
MIKPDEMPLDDFLREVAAIGFEGAEIWGRGDDFEDIVAACRRHHLQLVSMCGHASIESGLNDPSQHERIESELRASIDIAAAHGIPGVICFSGNRREGVSEEEAIETTVAGLRGIAPYAESKGVTLTMELLNSRFDHPGYQCDRTAWGVEVCRRVASPRVKLLYDIYHMQIMEGDVIRTISEHIDPIGHVHTAGVPGRFDPDDTQELNYGAICRVIEAAGYTGFVGHEFKPKGEAVAALRRAYAVCGGG